MRKAEGAFSFPTGCIFLLQGGEQQTRYDTDHEPLFRQESYFAYLFGVTEAGFFGAVVSAWRNVLRTCVSLLVQPCTPNLENVRPSR